MFTLTIFGRKYKIGMTLFWVVLVAGIAIMISSLIGIYRFGGGWLVALVVLLGTAVTTKSGNWAIIQNDRARNMFSRIAIIAGAGYFVYTTLQSMGY